MKRQSVLTVLLALLAAHATAQPAESVHVDAAAAGDAGISPFSAQFQADWKGITVGTSNIALKADGEPGRYVYTWTITARGIFRLAYSDDLVQTSWLSIDADHARPERYFGKQGSTSVALNFDWPNKRASGESEGKPVDLKLKDGTQDVMSIQVEVMLDLKSGNLPEIFHIIDKDQLKDFNYRREGSAKIKTAIGELDTVIVTSQQPGNNRILKMWFAPSLGYVPVQAERTRNGKLEMSMRIRSLNR
ncbi:MAG: DUF3108 domain-containing protein [Steroidobacteraceae bacterium]